MRQQQAELETVAGRGRAESGDGRRQRIDDALILMPFLERLGERVVSPGTLRVVGDQHARRRFGGVEIAEPPGRLRQEILRARILRTRRQHLFQNVACLRQLGPARCIQKRRRIADLEIEIPRRVRDRVLVGAGRVVPSVLALVELGERRVLRRIARRGLFQPGNRVGVAARARIGLGEQRRTFRPAGLFLHEIAQKRDRFGVRAGAQIQTRERRAHVRIDVDVRLIDRRGEVRDRFLDVVARRGGAARLRAAARFRERRVDDASHTMRLEIVRRNFQRLFGGLERVLHPVLPHVERGELCGDGAGRRVERHRAFVRGDRAGHIVVRLEIVRKHELVVRVGDLVRHRCGDLKRETDDRRQYDMHTWELFHKRR